MLLYGARVNVDTLKKLEGDLLSIYEDKVDLFLSNEDLLEQIIEESGYISNIVSSELIEKEGEGLFADQKIRVIRTCSKCGVAEDVSDSIYNSSNYYGCKCSGKTVYKYKIYKNGNLEQTPEEIENLAKTWQVKHRSDTIKSHTFFYPIVVQDDLLALAQFNIVSYLNTDDMSIKFLANDGFVKENRMSDFSHRCIFVISKKHGLRFINPRTDKMIGVHAMPKTIKDAFYYSKGQMCLEGWGTAENLSSKFVLGEDHISTEFISWFKEKYVKSENKDEEFKAHDFIRYSLRYKPSDKKRKVGVYRFDLEHFDEDDLIDNLKKFAKEKHETVVSFGYTSDRILVSDTKESRDGVDLQKITYEGTYKCQHCLGEGSVHGSVYHIDNGSYFDKNNLTDIEVKEQKCDHCGKTIFSNGSNLSATSEISIVIIDRDSKGRLVERVFMSELAVNQVYPESSDYVFYEKIRTIFYEKDSPNISITYVKSNDEAEFEKADYYNVSINNLNNSYYYQTKNEIREVLNYTDYEYSGLEDIIFKDNVRMSRIKYITEEDSYIFKYLNMPSIELLARLDGYDIILKEQVQSRVDFLNKNATNLKDLFGFTGMGFSIFRSLDPLERDQSSLNYIKEMERFFPESTNIDMFLKTKEIGLRSYGFMELSHIKENFGISLSSALNYIENVMTYQRIENLPDILMLWGDYLNMASELGRDLSNKNVRYPDSLKREHDIVSYDSRISAQLRSGKTLDGEKEVFEDLKKYEFEFKNYRIIAPKNRLEIIEEGSKQNHCVASYATDVAKGNKVVLFMRHKDNVDKPLYTIEVKNNHIYQVRGYMNRNMNALDELIFMENFKKAKNLKEI